MIGIEFVRDRKTKEPAKEQTRMIMKECLKRGLLVLGAGIFRNVIRMVMPLIITDEELDQGIFGDVCVDVLRK